LLRLGLVNLINIGMQLHELRSKLKRPKIKRIGRGGKRGTTSGKGQKGQKARAGHKIRPAERDLLSRLPKLRGVKNRPHHDGVFVVKTGQMERIFGDKPVSRGTLLQAGFIRRFNDKVKILDQGEVKKAFAIEGLPISAKAKARIEKAGGTVK